MLHNTRGIVLRSVKYGDSSLITTLFTEKQGVQTYIVQGARSTKTKSNKAAMLQPGTLLELVVYHKPQTNLQRIKEMQYAYIYTALQEEVLKNSITLFSTEVLLRLLPEHAEMPELFDFSFHYFQQLDKEPVNTIANFPVYFVIQCSKLLGYEIHGEFCDRTPYLNMQDGAFTDHMPIAGPYANDDEACALSLLLQVNTTHALAGIRLNADIRNGILDWLLEFLRQHTQHFSTIKSLDVLRAILH